MTKFLGGVVVGVFVGALTVEVLGRTHPELLEKVEDSARRTAARISDFIKRRQSAQVRPDAYRSVVDDVY